MIGINEYFADAITEVVVSLTVSSSIAIGFNSKLDLED
jgi:hypothetical protein